MKVTHCSWLNRNKEPSNEQHYFILLRLGCFLTCLLKCDFRKLCSWTLLVSSLDPVHRLPLYMTCSVLVKIRTCIVLVILISDTSYFYFLFFPCFFFLLLFNFTTLQSFFQHLGAMPKTHFPSDVSVCSSVVCTGANPGFLEPSL